MRIAILDDYQDLVRHLDCYRTLAGLDVTVLHHPARGLGQLAARLAPFEVLVPIRERSTFSAALLERLPALRLICQTGKVGPHIDLAACTARGIAVTESNGYAPATAELTWLLVLAAARRLPAYLAQLAGGRWQQSLAPAPDWPLAGLGVALAGRTLGLWGYGRIGQLVAGYGRAFGMRVQVWGSAASRARAEADGFAAANSREEFFTASDVLSLHLRLVESTRGCIGAADLARMQRDAIFVNTSRAELVAPGALAAALSNGRPGLAAVDVYEREPLSGADARAEPLLALPNAICSPHLGFTERRSYEALLGGAFEQVAVYARTRGG